MCERTFPRVDHIRKLSVLFDLIKGLLQPRENLLQFFQPINYGVKWYDFRISNKIAVIGSVVTDKMMSVKPFLKGLLAMFKAKSSWKNLTIWHILSLTIDSILIKESKSDIPYRYLNYLVFF